MTCAVMASAEARAAAMSEAASCACVGAAKGCIKGTPAALTTSSLPAACSVMIAR